MAEFELKALITGVDRLSPALSKMQKKIRGFKRQAEEASQGGLALGGGLAAGLTLSLKSYADQENAATGLKVAMMDANGEVGKSFQDINKLAIGLGNQLPGTTADFQNMMQMLVRQGIPAENILGGVGKATAYLAVQLKKTPEAAAEFAAKMQDATGTASEDMMGLFDTIQKAFYLGVDDTNMLSFFTKTSSVLKMVNKDGLQAAQSLAPISVMMDQMGMNGESAGNALRKVIQSGLSVKKIRDVNKIMARQKLGVQLDFTDGKGSFGGLDNMFRQLAKLRKLTDVKRTGVLKAIFGDDAETLQVVNALIDKGKDGYDQIQQKMNKQASLNKRVQAQLGTLSNLWEAMTGTATNGLAAIGGAFSGDAKNITQWLGELGEKFTKFADENPRVIRGVVGLAAGLAILKLGLMGVGGAISIVSRIMSMTPIGMIATAIALAAGLIITNWDVVGPYFKKLWETIGPYFEAGWELLKKVFAWSPLGMVINNWGPVVKWFQDMWDKLKPIIEWFTDSSGDTVDAINSAQWGAGAYDAYGTGIPARGYTPYQAVDPAQSNNASGASLGSDLQPRGVWKTDSKTTATATQQRNVVASTLRTTAISEAAYAVTRLPAPTTSAVMQNATVGQSTTPAQSTGWPSVTHPALNNAPAVKNTVDLPTWEELTDIRDTLNTAIDKELSRTTSDALFLALRRVKADLNADINTRLEQSARIIQRTPDEVLPALVLAATWFDNAARDADIIRRNAITHPGFVPVIPLKVPVQ
ncbi:phage tail tape measure protein [Escherichia coli]|nr:phage tail tape measure protein [Escherichia coli]EES8668658.1 phage tail tape measure protein [Escherichia coli]EES9472612.1 phage tail tape measure protein [Escherichia coli]EEV1172127.1 phage tail tape measure protein [Escherichia coli]EEW4712548.1 phage tail tape measure protein [Escherichia coli]